MFINGLIILKLAEKVWVMKHEVPLMDLFFGIHRLQSTAISVKISESSIANNTLRCWKTNLNQLSEANDVDFLQKESFFSTASSFLV